jgi:hypothetical protein
VVFYQMLTGELPGERMEPPSRKVQIDVRLDEVVMRALERDPGRRYSQASVLKTQVETIATEMGRSGESSAPARGRNYRSRQTLLGLPLIHVVWGIDPATGRPRVAKGILAVGPVAIGVLPVGLSAWGLCPCGLVAGGFWATGLFAVGFWAVGLAAAGFQAVGLLALASWHTVGLVAAGPSPIGLEKIVVGKGMVGLLFVLATVTACLMDRLIRAIGSAATLPAGRTEGKGLEGASSTARRKLPWIYCVCVVILLLIELASWWTRREPMGVWIPTRIDPTVSVDYGEAAVRVTDVSRLGQVVLVKLVCEIADSFRAHQLIVQYSGPVLDYPAHIASTVTNVDSLVAPTFVNGGGKALVGSREMPGAPAWQIGFVLPDEMTAAKVVEQLRATHLGKPWWLAEHRVLLLFSLHRNVGKDAKGKPVLESMSGMLGWSRDNESAVESTHALSFGPVIQRVVNLEFGTNCAIDLDSGRLMDGRDDVEEQGADAAGFGFLPISNPTLIGLCCINETFAMLVDATNWDNGGADWGRSRADKLPFGVKASELPAVTMSMTCSEEGELPSTYLFKTREGGRGILQITGFTENPPAVKIRYKLVLAQASPKPITPGRMLLPADDTQPSDEQIRQKILGTWILDDDHAKTIEHKPDGSFATHEGTELTAVGTWQVKDGFIVATMTSGSGPNAPLEVESNKVVSIDDYNVVVVTSQGGTNLVTAHKR